MRAPPQLAIDIAISIANNGPCAKSKRGVVTSGGPSCWQCSRLMFDPRIKGIWLFHDTGWRLYEPEEFHRLTLVECGLPVVRASK